MARHFSPLWRHFILERAFLCCKEDLCVRKVSRTEVSLREKGVDTSFGDTSSRDTFRLLDVHKEVSRIEVSRSLVGSRHFVPRHFLLPGCS